MKKAFKALMIYGIVTAAIAWLGLLAMSVANLIFAFARMMAEDPIVQNFVAACLLLVLILIIFNVMMIVFGKASAGGAMAAAMKGAGQMGGVPKGGLGNMARGLRKLDPSAMRDLGGMADKLGAKKAGRMINKGADAKSGLDEAKALKELNKKNDGKVNKKDDERRRKRVSDLDKASMDKDYRDHRKSEFLFDEKGEKLSGDDLLDAEKDARKFDEDAQRVGNFREIFPDLGRNLDSDQIAQLLDGNMSSYDKRRLGIDDDKMGQITDRQERGHFLDGLGVNTDDKYKELAAATGGDEELHSGPKALDSAEKRQEKEEIRERDEQSDRVADNAKDSHKADAEANKGTPGNETAEKAMHISQNNTEHKEATVNGSDNGEGPHAQFADQTKEAEVASGAHDPEVHKEVAGSAAEMEANKNANVAKSQPGMPEGEGYQELRAQTIQRDSEGNPLSSFDGDEIEQAGETLGRGDNPHGSTHTDNPEEEKNRVDKYREGMDPAVAGSLDTTTDPNSILEGSADSHESGQDLMDTINSEEPEKVEASRGTDSRSTESPTSYSDNPVEAISSMPGQQSADEGVDTTSSDEFNDSTPGDVPAQNNGKTGEESRGAENQGSAPVSASSADNVADTVDSTTGYSSVGGPATGEDLPAIESNVDQYLGSDTSNEFSGNDVQDSINQNEGVPVETSRPNSGTSEASAPDSQSGYGGPDEDRTSTGTDTVSSVGTQSVQDSRPQDTTTSTPTDTNNPTSTPMGTETTDTVSSFGTQSAQDSIPQNDPVSTPAAGSTDVASGVSDSDPNQYTDSGQSGNATSDDFMRAVNDPSPETVPAESRSASGRGQESVQSQTPSQDRSVPGGPAQESNVTSSQPISGDTGTSAASYGEGPIRNTENTASHVPTEDHGFNGAASGDSGFAGVESDSSYLTGSTPETRQSEPVRPEATANTDTNRQNSGGFSGDNQFVGGGTAQEASTPQVNNDQDRRAPSQGNDQQQGTSPGVSLPSDGFIDSSSDQVDGRQFNPPTYSPNGAPVDQQGMVSDSGQDQPATSNINDYLSNDTDSGNGPITGEDVMNNLNAPQQDPVDRHSAQDDSGSSSQDPITPERFSEGTQNAPFNPQPYGPNGVPSDQQGQTPQQGPAPAQNQGQVPQQTSAQGQAPVPNQGQQQPSTQGQNPVPNQAQVPQQTQQGGETPIPRPDQQYGANGQPVQNTQMFPGMPQQNVGPQNNGQQPTIGQNGTQNNASAVSGQNYDQNIELGMSAPFMNSNGTYGNGIQLSPDTMSYLGMMMHLNDQENNRHLTNELGKMDARHNESMQAMMDKFEAMMAKDLEDSGDFSGEEIADEISGIKEAMKKASDRQDDFLEEMDREKMKSYMNDNKNSGKVIRDK